MKSVKLATLILALSATPALAHEGEHNAFALANVMHWLSSPTHSLFAVIGGVAVAAIIFKLSRKKA